MDNQDPLWRPGFKYVTRSLTVKDVPTSIAMERFYWQGLDLLARERGASWRDEVTAALSKKPKGYSSRAGWLRIWVFAKILRQAKRQRK
jgi:predicted DNA-binding ribbon-helix-helix protein